MQRIIQFFIEPWPWYISGPLIGLTVPLLILTSNKRFGVSSLLRDICAVSKISKNEYFNYNLMEELWRFLFVLGAIIAGVFAFQILDVTMGDLSDSSLNYFNNKNIEVKGIFPLAIFNWETLFSVYGLLLIFGGFLIGFGSRYAGGCTSGHAIMGLSLLSKASFISVIGFFIGGIIGTFLILDYFL